ncbi:MAG: hypothetical protein EA384_15225 [Spirochaetaceae bacterium]|nr:MAG: hypothetical protein EA384_15225 [Spirochaetaceae bacterium]
MEALAFDRRRNNHEFGRPERRVLTGWAVLFAFHVSAVIWAYSAHSSGSAPGATQFFYLSVTGLTLFNLALIGARWVGDLAFSLPWLLLYLVTLPTDLPFLIDLLLLLPVMYEVCLLVRAPRVKIGLSVLYAIAAIIHTSHSFDPQIQQYTVDSPTLINASVLLSFNVLIILLCIWFVSTLKSSQREINRLRNVQQQMSWLGERALLYAADAKLESAENERNRITREIHDSLGYAFTNIIMIAEAMGHVHHDADRIKQMAQDLKQQAVHGLQETRSILRIVRSERFAPQNSLNSLLLRFKELSTRGALGLSVSVDFGGVCPVTEQSVLHHLQKILQEAVVNSIKHGRASEMSIRLRRDANNFHLNISDNGIGCPHIVQGIGLRSMQERAAQLDGTVECRSAQHGFSVQLSIPLWRIIDGQDKSIAR